VNLSRDHYRHQKRQPRKSDINPEVVSELPHLMMAERIDERLEIQRVLGDLPQQQREVVGLRYLVGLSVAEVAAVLLIPEGTVKSNASRAISALRKSLENINEEKIHVD
jgi:RNA polymerase sigma factor (sigma-70 family)